MTASDFRTAAAAEKAVAGAQTGRVGTSGNRLADGVLSGHEWKGSTLTFAFPDSSMDYAYGREPNSGYFSINSLVQNSARRVLETAFGLAADDGFSVTGFTKITLLESTDHAGADIRFAGSEAADPTAYAYYPTAGAALDKGRSGDVWFGSGYDYQTAQTQPTFGEYEFMVVMHEIGHALGLKHGHEATRDDTIKTVLTGKYDSFEYSVMTYHSYPGVNSPTSEDFGYPQTFMMADIRALQHMYGADYSANAGDTTYRWSPDSGDTVIAADGVDPQTAIDMEGKANRIFATIWDGAGDDTYDLSAYSTRVVIDLRPGRFSIFSEEQRVDLGAFDDVSGPRLAAGNIYNALQVGKNRSSLIENATGGSGDDKLIGNAANNALFGGGGDDTFVYRKHSNVDRIGDFGDGADVIDISHFAIRNFNRLLHLMTDGPAGVTIDFGGGNMLVVTEMSKGDFEATDFLI